jgi:hypothetical protein
VNWNRIILELEEKLGFKGKPRDLSQLLSVTPHFLTDLKSGKSKNPNAKFVLTLINTLGINPLWIETGEGAMFLSESNFRPKQEDIKPELVGLAINANGSLQNVGNFGNITVVSRAEAYRKGEIVPPEPNAETASSVQGGTEEAVQKSVLYAIPLLNKEDALALDPKQDKVGLLPYRVNLTDIITFVQVPVRIGEFGVDLRAIVVADNRMVPIMSCRDIAIFEVSDWSGDGIYVYRMHEDIHITYIKYSNRQLVLSQEFMPEQPIPDDDLFFVIGRVRGVVKEVP